MYELDRDKCEKVLVWTDPEDSAQERILLNKNSNGSCICVDYYSEEEFMEGEEFDTIFWKHYKPIPKKQWRKCTNEELEIFKDCWFRDKINDCGQAKPTAYSYRGLYFKNEWIDSQKLFDYQEVNYNGEWQRVGILEGT